MLSMRTPNLCPYVSHWKDVVNCRLTQYLLSGYPSNPRKVANCSTVARGIPSLLTTEFSSA